MWSVQLNSLRKYRNKHTPEYFIISWIYEYLTPANELDKIARVFIILFLLQIVCTIWANIIIKDKSQYLEPYFTGKVCR